MGAGRCEPIQKKGARGTVTSLPALNGRTTAANDTIGSHLWDFSI